MVKLTSAQVAARLGRAHSTIRLWCNRKLFSNAERIDTPNGGYWLIPESDLKDFVKPSPGRPPNSSTEGGKRATGRLRARTGTSTGKKKGGKK
jgi:hypothetical protein